MKRTSENKGGLDMIARRCEEVMEDIDQLACEMCLKHLPEWSDGCDKDPRFEVSCATLGETRVVSCCDGKTQTHKHHP